MERFFRTLAIAGSLGGLPFATQALEAVELDAPLLVKGVSSPPTVPAAGLTGEAGGPGWSLDLPRARPSPYPAVLAALEQRGFGLATGLPQGSDRTWGAQLLAGLTGIAFLMWRRLQWQ